MATNEKKRKPRGKSPIYAPTGVPKGYGTRRKVDEEWIAKERELVRRAREAAKNRPRKAKKRRPKAVKAGDDKAIASPKTELETVNLELAELRRENQELRARVAALQAALKDIAAQAIRASRHGLLEAVFDDGMSQPANGL